MCQLVSSVFPTFNFILSPFIQVLTSPYTVRLFCLVIIDMQSDDFAHRESGYLFNRSRRDFNVICFSSEYWHIYRKAKYIQYIHAIFPFRINYIGRHFFRFQSYCRMFIQSLINSISIKFINTEIISSNPDRRSTTNFMSVVLVKSLTDSISGGLFRAMM